MDWRRSFSQGVMQVSADPSKPYLMPVTWYEAPPGAKTFRGVSAFSSGIWDRDQPLVTYEIGDQRPYFFPYYNGRNVWGYLGQCFVGSLRDYEFGLAADRIASPPPFNPLCCRTPPDTLGVAIGIPAPKRLYRVKEGVRVGLPRPVLWTRAPIGVRIGVPIPPLVQLAGDGVRIGVPIPPLVQLAGDGVRIGVPPVHLVEMANLGIRPTPLAGDVLTTRLGVRPTPIAANVLTTQLGVRPTPIADFSFNAQTSLGIRLDPINSAFAHARTPITVKIYPLMIRTRDAAPMSFRSSPIAIPRPADAPAVVGVRLDPSAFRQIVTSVSLSVATTPIAEQFVTDVSIGVRFVDSVETWNQISLGVAIDAFADYSFTPTSLGVAVSDAITFIADAPIGVRLDWSWELAPGLDAPLGVQFGDSVYQQFISEAPLASAVGVIVNELILQFAVVGVRASSSVDLAPIYDAPIGVALNNSNPFDKEHKATVGAALDLPAVNHGPYTLFFGARIDPIGEGEINQRIVSIGPALGIPIPIHGAAETSLGIAVGTKNVNRVLTANSLGIKLTPSAKVTFGIRVTVGLTTGPFAEPAALRVYAGIGVSPGLGAFQQIPKSATLGVAIGIPGTPTIIRSVSVGVRCDPLAAHI